MRGLSHSKHAFVRRLHACVSEAPPLAPRDGIK